MPSEPLTADQLRETAAEDKCCPRCGSGWYRDDTTTLGKICVCRDCAKDAPYLPFKESDIAWLRASHRALAAEVLRLREALRELCDKVDEAGWHKSEIESARAALGDAVSVDRRAE